MRNRHLSLLIALLGLLAIGAVSGAGAPAFAADCGGIIPCSCGDNVVADRILVCGVDPVTTTVCTGDGLIMNTDGVTLNLNFCTIRGDGGEVGIHIIDGVVDDAVNNVRVQSGRITGFGVGVATAPMIGTTDGSTLTGLNIYDNGAGIHVIATDTTVKNNLVRLNDANGITVLGDTNIVSGNRSEENGAQGIVVHGVMNTITGNFSQRNGGDGFEIDGQAAVVKQNRAKYNDLEGFRISGRDHWITLNEAHMNGTDGFTVFAIMSKFDRNRSDYNGDFGIREVMAVGNAYTANRCTGNQDGPSSPAGLCK